MNNNKKNGPGITRVARKLEDFPNKHAKVQLDIPSFAKVNAAIKHGTQKVKVNIARVVMETEIQSKHDQKGKIKKQPSQHATSRGRP